MKPIEFVELVGPNPSKYKGLKALAKNVKITANNNTLFHIQDLKLSNSDLNYYEIATWLELNPKASFPNMVVKSRKMYVIIGENYSVYIIDNKGKTLLQLDKEEIKYIMINGKTINTANLKFKNSDIKINLDVYANA